MDDNDKLREWTQREFNQIVEREYANVDPETTQEQFDAAWMMLMMRNYNLAEAREAEISITACVMIEHAELITRYPELFS